MWLLGHHIFALVAFVGGAVDVQLALVVDGRWLEDPQTFCALAQRQDVPLLCLQPC